MRPAKSPQPPIVVRSIQAHRSIAAMLLVSGAVALVYEVIWQRQFALLFGSAAPAAAAVLGAYFAGMGAGALVIGRWAQRWSRPLRAYAVLEASVGGGALLVAPLLAAFERAYPWFFQAFASQPGWFLAGRTGVAFVVIFIPTLCMGGTLPLLGQWMDRGQQHLGLTAGWLYVVNTAGAGLGAVAFPFLLFSGLGMAHSVMLCAATNFLLAGAAWILDRRSDAPPMEPVAAPKKKRHSSASLAEVKDRPILGPALMSGVVTFALQVLWNRAFAQVHENSLYSFATIVAVVIFALAIGAQLARFGLRRGLAPHRLVGGAWMLAGLAVIAGPWVFIRLSDGLAYLSADGGWATHAWHLFALAAAVLLAPMVLLGVSLPAIMEQAGRTPTENVARLLGRVFAVNVAGSVLGALAAGYLLPHWLGLWPGMLALGTLLLAAGLWQAARWTGSAQSLRAAVILMAAWLGSLWPISLSNLPRVNLATSEGERLIAITEGTHGITAVVERRGSRRLKLNNHYGLGGTLSTGDERMQAHIPLLLHPAPRRVAFLGLGTGITAGGALFHPVEQVTVIELVPEVVAASREYFRDANRSVLDDPRTRVVQDDARNFLRGSGEHFDVIIGDLVVPWRQGEGSLFTLEQFAAARRALAPGGVFCQWLPLFQLSEVEVDILARTFLTVFPRAQVWRGDFSPTAPAIALIGTADNQRFDPNTVARRIASLAPDPSNPQLRSPEAFWMNYVGQLEPADLPTGETRLNREDRPWIELLGPMLHAGGQQDVLFTGRRLQAWLDHLIQRSQGRSPRLPDREANAVAAGSVLAELTLCLSDGNDPGAQAAQQRLRQMLPADAYRLLFP